MRAFVGRDSAGWERLLHMPALYELARNVRGWPTGLLHRRRGRMIGSHEDPVAETLEVAHFLCHLGLGRGQPCMLLGRPRGGDSRQGVEGGRRIERPADRHHIMCWTAFLRTPRER